MDPHLSLHWFSFGDSASRNRYYRRSVTFAFLLTGLILFFAMVRPRVSHLTSSSLPSSWSVIVFTYSTHQVKPSVIPYTSQEKFPNGELQRNYPTSRSNVRSIRNHWPVLLILWRNLSKWRSLHTNYKAGRLQSSWMTLECSSWIPNAELRQRYYRNHNIGWVARPGHKKNRFVRAGRFKKVMFIRYEMV